MGSCLLRASMQVTTAYFLAGGRAREPEVKEEAYLEFESMRFCWIGVAMFVAGCLEFCCVF